MEKGDIANDVAGRLLFVFEGLIGVLPDNQELTERFYRRVRAWKRAAALWEIDSRMLAHLWDIVWRSRFPLDVVTFLPEPYAGEMKLRLDNLQVPYGHFQVYESAHVLGRRLAHMPYVQRVYYGLPGLTFVFGSKGELVTDPGVFRLT